MLNLTLQPLKTYLSHYNAYGHQAWQSGYLPWVAPTHKVTWPFDQGSVTNWNHCPHYSNAFDHQAWQGGDMQWGFPTHKITWSFNHVTYWGHRKNYMRYISTCTRPMGTKLGNLVTYHERLLPINSNDSLITWPTCVTNWKKIYLYFHDLGMRFRTQTHKSSPTSCSVVVNPLVPGVH